MYLEVPSYLHKELKQQATDAGLSLRVYMLNALNKHANETNKQNYLRGKQQ